MVAAIQGGEAARNLADDPNANISAQRLVRGTGLSVEYVRRMILAHGLDAVNAFANDILAEQHRAKLRDHAPPPDFGVHLLRAGLRE